MNTFSFTLHKTYYSMGFFNVPVNVDAFIGDHDASISIVVVPGQMTIHGKINRSANTNKTARIMGTSLLRDWFQEHCTIMATIEVHIVNPTQIRLYAIPRLLQNIETSDFQNDINHVIFSVSNTPLIEITPYSDNPNHKYQEITLSQQQSANISNILSHSAVAGLNSAILNGTYMLKFSPEIAQQLANGTLHMMPSLDAGIRAMAVNSSGQIVGQASLISAGQGAMIMVASWHILSVVTAQHHMIAINKQISEIQSTLSDVKQLIETQDLDTLNGHIRYLHTIYKSITEGKYNLNQIPVYITKIEDIDHDCERLFERFTRIVNMKYKKIIDINVSGIFSIQDDLEEIKNAFKDYSYTLDWWMLLIKLKIFILEIKHILPINHKNFDSELESIQDRIFSWRNEQINNINNLSIKKKNISTFVENVFGLWNNKNEREEFLEMVIGLRKYLKKESRKVEMLSQEFANQLLNNRNIRSTQLLIKVSEDRSIKSVRYLLDAD